jgi:hydrogenase large subunit
MGWNSGTGQLTIDPINRMEGHMGAKCTAQPASGTNEKPGSVRIVRAEMHGNLFRGFELILKGRDPRDAMVLTQRICGVCPIGHGTASSKNIGNLLGYAIHDEDPHVKTSQATLPVPVAGEALRNLVLAANHIMSHILHFYHLVALDYVNTGLPKPFLCPRYDDSYYINTTRVLEAAPFLTTACVTTLSTLPGWGTDPGMAVNNYLVGQYLKALDMRRKAHEMCAIFGGKMPHAACYTPGGATATIDSTRINAYANLLAQLKAFIGEPLDFANGVAGTMFFDTVAAAHLFPEYFWIGNAWGNFMAYGWGESDTATTPLALTGELGSVFGSVSNPDNRLSRRGRKNSAAAGAPVRRVAPAGMDNDGTPRIVETVKHSRYSSTPPAYRHPWAGQTIPWPQADATAPKKYSWLKSPRYRDEEDGVIRVYEVGPLSRMVVQGLYWGGVLNVLGYTLCPTYGASGLTLNTSGTPFAACYSNQGPDLSATTYTGDSVLDRIAARTLETRVMCDMATHELNRLVAGASGCTDPPLKASKKGYGMTEASRGALGHWIKTDANGKVKKYQCVVPTTWNGSPRDKGTNNPGPAEKSLQGNNADTAPLDPSPAGGGVWIADPNQPIEVIRTTHSYDFCIACAVHIVTPSGDVKKVVVPPLP